MPSVEDTARALSLDLPTSASTATVSGCSRAGPRFFYVPLNTREALARARVMRAALVARRCGAMGIGNAYLYVRGGDNAEDTASGPACMRPPTAFPRIRPPGPPRRFWPRSFCASERLSDGTHRWKLEQGYEMGRPSDLWLEADVAAAKLVAVRVAGQAVQISSGVLEI